MWQHCFLQNHINQWFYIIMLINLEIRSRKRDPKYCTFFQYLFEMIKCFLLQLYCVINIYNTEANPRKYMNAFDWFCFSHSNVQFVADIFMDPYNRLGGSNLNNNWKSSFANWKGWSASRGWSLASWRPRTVFSSCSFLQWSRTRPWRRLLSLVRSIFWLRQKKRSLNMVWVGFSFSSFSFM